ncbi:alpha/beta hydrolase [Hymenobacter sp.]|uniref:alpha/beta fold hydrolase n=1 Tax=Hymenobacter sp. TaxID=1898978 RepID=UPI00286A2573|nr:alpha/beta hydrolase [Hymenobacter sp.]
MGSGVTERLALAQPGSLAGIHLTDVPYWHLFALPPDDLSAAEQEYLDRGKQWQMTEGAYALLQATKPQTLAYGLADSPAGLAAWLVEKFQSWSDCGGEIERRFTKDELLTNLTLYWATETIRSSFTPYFDEEPFLPPQPGKIQVPTGVAIFPHDLVPAPRAYAERFYNVQRWTEMPRGGHFAALEEPELLAEDLWAFFRPLRRPNEY